MTSKSYVATETEVTFDGTTDADVVWSMEGVSDGAGRVSAQYDLGASPRAKWFRWDCEFLGQATPVQFDELELYVAGAPDSDATMIDGDVGNSDAALGDIDQVTNLQSIGSVIAEEANTTKMKGSGIFQFTNRYISLVGLNNIGAAINATDSNFVFILTPIPDQGQDT